MNASLLVIEQHRHHAEEIYRDIHSLFSHYNIATTVKEAQRYLNEHDYNMVIINPFFSDGNGRNVIQALKNHANYSMVPIIVVSELPSKHVKLDFYSYGADIYVEMPYDKKWFFNNIKDELERHFRIVADSGRDSSTEFLSREEFELDYSEDQRRIRDNKEMGFVGLIAPAGIDFVIRDYGLETGVKLMASLSQLMKNMCSGKLQATIWTQKSIIFAMMNKSDEEISEALHQLRRKFLERFEDIAKLQETPGLRAVLTAIPFNVSLNETINSLSNQLVQISRHPNANPVQYYGENTSAKRHIMIADPDKVATNVIKHRLKMDGYEPHTFMKIPQILKVKDNNEIAAILIDSIVSGGGVNMLKKIHNEPELFDIPIMLLSRYGYEDEIAQAFQAGAQDYLMKPISMVELSARMKRLTG